MLVLKAELDQLEGVIEVGELDLVGNGAIKGRDGVVATTTTSHTYINFHKAHRRPNARCEHQFGRRPTLNRQQSLLHLCRRQ